jgi:transketolase
VPNLLVLRPCDANETAEAWRIALMHAKGPVALVLTRQNLPILDREKLAAADGLQRGGYILTDSEGGRPDLILLATGSEVPIALEAADRLKNKGIGVRVVSMPGLALFDQQPQSYRRHVLPEETAARLAIEAGCSQGWHRYVGIKGVFMGMERFGASAPYRTLYEKFGLTAEAVVEKALALLNQTPAQKGDRKG